MQDRIVESRQWRRGIEVGNVTLLGPPSSAGASVTNPAGYRLRMLRRAERWRRRISMLSLAIVGASPRARVALSREFNALVTDCERIVRTIEALATAVDSHAWNETRAQVEQAWADLVTRTRRLQRRVHQHLRAPRHPPRASRSRSAEGDARRQTTLRLGTGGLEPAHRGHDG